MAAIPDTDGCEIVIVLPNSIEAYAYRGTASQGLEWQDCWDSFANIIEICITEGPNTGWVNGPDVYEFFHAGYRLLHGNAAKHAPLDASNALQKYCPSPAPSCDTCQGGDNNNICMFFSPNPLPPATK
jgi:hypothetical protein